MFPDIFKNSSSIGLLAFLGLCAAGSLLYIHYEKHKAKGVDIPDPNLRAAIAEALQKAPEETITRAEMETLHELKAPGREITNLRGIEFAINLKELTLFNNTISDISPLARLTHLRTLFLSGNFISNISPLANLKNLLILVLPRNSISDISPLANLKNLKKLNCRHNTISDIQTLDRLMEQGTVVYFSGNPAFQTLGPQHGVDIPDPNLRAVIAEALSKPPGETITRAEMESEIENVVYLSHIRAQGREITDLRGIEFAIDVFNLHLQHNTISDISPLVYLTNLYILELQHNTISDISPLANLKNLQTLNLGHNTISDISPLANLKNLQTLNLGHNTISDIQTLDRLMEQGTVVYFPDNPAFQTPGPQIEDGWIWLILPTIRDEMPGTYIPELDEAPSKRDIFEAHIAVNGASAGTQVTQFGNSVWTPPPLTAADPANLDTIARDIIGSGYDLAIYDLLVYGVVSIHSEKPQRTRMYISGFLVDVWLNGTRVYRNSNYLKGIDYVTAVPVTLNAGENLLFIAAYRHKEIWDSGWGASFGFQNGTVYTTAE
ncbi:MAG: leucine-rich repeat domain-containing protein [Candidatus Poribacteria bacterium]|nr:leucine-rich repeat domain-containing protein [Candidatus Poribacteria bacterium]